jgi:hypothetical protein
MSTPFHIYRIESSSCTKFCSPLHTKPSYGRSTSASWIISLSSPPTSSTNISPNHPRQPKATSNSVLPASTAPAANACITLTPTFSDAQLSQTNNKACSTPTALDAYLLEHSTDNTFSLSPTITTPITSSLFPYHPPATMISSQRSNKHTTC